MKTVPARNVLRNSSEPSEADDLLGLHIDQSGIFDLEYLEIFF
jgi:hypothetical protein